MKRFYTNNIQGNIAFLENEEALHCSKVLRCRINDKVEILNGNGALLSGQISNIQKLDVQITIIGKIKEQIENANRISIGICLTKNPARIEWFVEKATEIGIVSIFPLVSERTEKQNIKLERLQNIIISAAKQSGQLHFPTLHTTQSLKSFLQETYQYEQKFIAHCEDEKQQLKNVYQRDKNAIILIGPEGDFTKEEIAIAINKNYMPISLGNSILRVETAGVMACAIINSINND
ncbi:MAG: 16S rRNA (uracil(1498)-N(3))-methyltransferase [Chitinophagales bacterium]|nr:16S rRNA (uracil(1498)-N(3))-methyltransferase [Chitinophagales bacterium]